MTDEFDLIRRYFANWDQNLPGVRLGIGDDCALLCVPPHRELAVTSDTLVAGRHFPLDTRPFDIGWKALAVNLSDLAAMGAEPRWFTLALTLPDAEETWLEGFSRGLRELAGLHRIALVGGDTTRGGLAISITAMGLVLPGQALRRDGAQPGDAICVTGTLGDAALGLKLHGRREGEVLRTRLDRPTPRVSAGLALRGIASAAVDLSDGLAGDLAHVLERSRVGALVEADRLPMSTGFIAAAQPSERLALQAQGGDDYELCVCIPPERVEEARGLLDVPLTVIGCITAEPGLRFIDAAGATMDIEPRGYRHFQ
ncbi:MAG: thiamine-phosphate kinase [Panacagrimonas sp.]